MGTTKFPLHASVYMIFEKENKVLLLRRFNTGWEDGKYTLPAGHLDGGETVVQTAAREAKEELGIEVSTKDCKIVHAMHRNSNYEYIDYFVLITKWSGEPVNKEPDKADDLSWFAINNLPDATLHFIHHALECYNKSIPFSEDGFEK